LRKDTSPEDLDGFYDAKGTVNRQFTFSEFLEREGYYLIEVHYYEGRSFELINAKTGASVRLRDKPEMSPDRLRFFVLVVPGYSSGTNRIEVWRIESQRLEKEWTFDPRDWPEAIGEWQDSSTISVHEWNWSEERGFYRGKLLGTVRKETRGWVMSGEREP
jgi:hypothetical protein